MNIINLYEKFNLYFDADLKAIFEIISSAASNNNIKVYLIGGLVRDLLLNRKSLDVDITIEGDAIKFARILELQKKAKILSLHEDFGTAKVKINGVKIDFAPTRSETYPQKGRLPKVGEIGCALEKDILRRDFTINALAISLNKSNFGDLIDFVDGYEDLKTQKIKILHEKSFIDDPTRIIRALKYSSRLGFKLDKQTLNLQQAYLQNVNYDLCNKRIKNEFKKTFEQHPAIAQIAFDKFIEQRIYKLITQSEIRQRNSNIEGLIRKYQPKNHWLIYLGIIAVFEEEELLDKLELTKAEKEIILSAKVLLEKELSDDFGIYKSFKSKKTETLLILAMLGKEKEIVHYLDNLQQIKLSIDGNDLLSLGINPSKIYSEVFDYLLREKLKNPDLKKEAEIELIKKYLVINFN